MDSDYREYFARRSVQLTVGRPLDEEVRFGFRDQPIAHEIASGAVEAARGALPAGVILRPDAELALYVLASELVTRPVLDVQPDSAGSLREDVTADAMTIARVAVANLAPAQEISAHGVIDGLSQSWAQLRTSSWRLWDRYAE